MTTPPPPYAAPGPHAPPARSGDTTASILALVTTALVGGLGVLMSLMTMAFVDGCTDDCDPDVLVRNAMLMIVTALVLGLGGLVLTVVRLGRRQPAWPFALATLVVVTGIFAIGFAFQFST